MVIKTMEIVRTKQALQEAIRRLRALGKMNGGKTIGLVPTMGALHEGHISLVEIAHAHASVVVMSIFVNPTQFAPHEDFSQYPRMQEADIVKAEKAGTEIVYLPAVGEMYTPNASTRVQVQGISNELCGAFRPGHFDGVATVVTKLFMQVTPDIAIFGEKDYQQLHVIKQFTRDLDLPVTIVGAPILRELDGLAMSSRNRYLDAEQRVIAASMNSILLQTSIDISKGGNISALLTKARKALRTAGFNKIDYVELRDSETLEPVIKLQAPSRLLAAAWLGTTRLIDNIAL